MNKMKLLQRLQYLHIDSASDFQNDKEFQNWANKVHPIIAKVSLPYLIEFEMAQRISNKEQMVQSYHKARNSLRLDIELSDDRSTQEYYSTNSQYSMQKRISEFLNEAADSIRICDAYMDVSTLIEFESVRARKILLLTNNLPKKQFSQRLEAFQKEHPYLSIEARKSNSFHDRYYIIDDKRVLHCGSSLNHAGEKATNLHEIEHPEEIHRVISDVKSWWETAAPFDKYE